MEWFTSAQNEPGAIFVKNIWTEKNKFETRDPTRSPATAAGRTAIHLPIVIKFCLFIIFIKGHLLKSCYIVAMKSIVSRVKAKWWLFPAIILLLLSQFNWDYSYYQLLRVVVCFSSVFLAYSYSNETDAGNKTVLYSMIALLFNPIFPIHLDRFIWAVLDFGTAFIIIREVCSKR